MKHVRVTSFTKGIALPLQFNCPLTFPTRRNCLSCLIFDKKRDRVFGVGERRSVHPAPIFSEFRNLQSTQVSVQSFSLCFCCGFSSASYTCFLFLRGSSKLFVYQWYPLLFLSTVIYFNFFL